MDLVEEINEQLEGKTYSGYNSDLFVGTPEWSFRARNIGGGGKTTINVSILIAGEQTLEGVLVLMCDEKEALLDTEPLSRSDRRPEFWVNFHYVRPGELSFKLKRTANVFPSLD